MKSCPGGKVEVFPEGGSSSSLTVSSGTLPPQNTLQARRANGFILTSRARPKKGFLRYGVA